MLELNTDAISGEIRDDPILRLNVEESIAKALREKYRSLGSYSVFLMTASKEELKMDNHLALRDRGYTHLLVTALNPEKMTNSVSGKTADKSSQGEFSGPRSMNVSCTIYRLTDGMPISLVNADVYGIGKDYWGRKAAKRTETVSERWKLGTIYSCDQALKAVTR